MKKILIVAAFVLGLSVMAAEDAAALINKEIKAFISSDAKCGVVPASWLNKTIAVERKDGKLTIKNTDPKKLGGFYLNPKFTVKDGETIKVTYRVSGKGTARIGLWWYNAKKQNFATGYSVKNVTSVVTEYTGTFKKPAKALEARPALLVGANSDVVFESVVFELLPAAK